PFWAAHRGPRRPAPADQRRRGSGAARGYWSPLAATMKGQVFSFEHLGCLVVGATGTKANGGGHFVAGLLRRWQCFHRLTRPGCAYLLPPNLLRPLPLYRLQFLGFRHLLREGLLPLPVKLNDRLSLVKVVGIADDLYRDGFHPKGQSRLPTSVAADDGAILLDGERHHYPMPPNTLNEILRQNLIPV